MAEVGSIRGGDGSIPGEEIKKEPQFLQPSTRLAILSAMAPTRSEAEIGDLRRLVLAAEPTKTYTIPSQVEPKYTCDVCGNRDQTKFLHESKDGDVVCLGIGDQGCGNVVEEHKLFEGNQFRKFEGRPRRPSSHAIAATAHVDAVAATSNCIATPFLTQARRTSRITVLLRTSCTVQHII